MGYVVLSTLMNNPIAMLVISYNVACQWSKNFPSHLAMFSSALQLDLNSVKLACIIPKFHINAHSRNCQTIWSLNYWSWMGQTDREGVEWEWSHINPVTLSMKVMGPGAHHNTFDDHWGAWNWQKVVSLGMFPYLF